MFILPLSCNNLSVDFHRLRLWPFCQVVISGSITVKFVATSRNFQRYPILSRSFSTDTKKSSPTFQSRTIHAPFSHPNRLSSSNLTAFITSQYNEDLLYAAGHFQGRRSTMEDRHQIVLGGGSRNEKMSSLFALFDGHAGKIICQRDAISHSQSLFFLLCPLVCRRRSRDILCKSSLSNPDKYQSFQSQRVRASSLSSFYSIR
jgi:hypothetical protein